MNEFQRLCAYLKILYNNLTTLHRNLVHDVAWFGNHEQIASWYGEVAEQLDDLIEIGLSLGYKEPSISDSIMLFAGDVLVTDQRDLRKTYQLILDMFRGASGMMKAAEAIVPPDVQNRLQEYEYHWNKEGNYKLAHALGDMPGGKPPEDDD